MWTILVVFILIAIVAAFSVIVVKISSRDKNRERAAFVHRFRKLASDHDLSIGYEDILDDLAIGLDTEKMKLLFLKRVSTNNYNSNVVDLNGVASSAKRELWGRVYPGKYAVLSDALQLEKIVLDLRFEDERDPLQISFYDFIANSYHDIGERKEKANRWETLLFNLRALPQRKRA